MSADDLTTMQSVQESGSLENAKKEKKEKKSKKEKKEKKRDRSDTETVATESEETNVINATTDSSCKRRRIESVETVATVADSAEVRKSSVSESKSVLDIVSQAITERIPNGPLKKNFYNIHPTLKALSSEEIQSFRSEKSMKILSNHNHNDNAPAPIRSFDEIAPSFPKEINNFLKATGFPSPSPIQSQGWPVALSGRDLIGIAETGSGKTLAFLLPAIVHLLNQGYKNESKMGMGLSYHRNNSGSGSSTSNSSSPIALVLAPTRELAQQIKAECDKVEDYVKNAVKLSNGNSNPNFHHFNLRSTALVGGVPKGGQIWDLKKGVEIIVATPGRLMDLLEMNLNFGFDLSRTSFLILDEADRMLDMGFEKPIRDLSNLIRKDRQTLLYSATWPKEVRKLARDICTGCGESYDHSASNNPVHIHIGEGHTDELKANKRITQTVEVLPWSDHDRKIRNMKKVMEDEYINWSKQEKNKGIVMKTVVFCGRKKECDKLAYDIQKQILDVQLKENVLAPQQKWSGSIAIHGDRDQQSRDWALAQFKSQTSGYDVLVATDVAARGLDVKSVGLVINYDFPKNVEDYVHRIGRTARGGNDSFGRAYTFVSEEDRKDCGKAAYELVEILKKAGQEVPEGLEAMGRRPGGKGGKGKGKGKGFRGKGSSWGRY